MTCGNSYYPIITSQSIIKSIVLYSTGGPKNASMVNQIGQCASPKNVENLSSATY